MDNSFKFDEENGLGNKVLKSKPFCKLTKDMDVPSYKYVVGDFQDKKYPGLVGKKFSRLCGFTFKSNNPNAPTELFQIVYVPKLKGPLTRNNHGLHGWYCWMVLPNGERTVISIDDLRRKYGFDVNKFFHSDCFEKTFPIFQSNILHVLQNQMKLLIDSTPSEDQPELLHYVNAIKDSVRKIDEVQTFVTYSNKYDDSGNPEYAKGSTPKVGHAKIAYNADKTYTLKNIDKKYNDKAN